MNKDTNEHSQVEDRCEHHIRRAMELLDAINASFWIHLSVAQLQTAPYRKETGQMHAYEDKGRSVSARGHNTCRGPLGSYRLHKMDVVRYRMELHTQYREVETRIGEKCSHFQLRQIHVFCTKINVSSNLAFHKLFEVLLNKSAPVDFEMLVE